MTTPPQPRAIDAGHLDAPTANYTPPFREAWPADLRASVVVFLVAVPLCLGIALASGAPLLSGLITGIIGGIVVGMASGSHLMVSGPAAGLTAIVLSAIASAGSFEAFLVAVFLAGLMQIALGFAHAGVIGYYFPNAVIRGMLAGIGVIIILKQLPHAVGYDADAEGDLGFAQANDENTFSAIGHALQQMHAGAIVVSLLGLAILILWDRPFMKRFALIPGALVAVVVSVILNTLFTGAFSISGDHLVNLPVGTLSELAAAVSRPDWSALAKPAVWTIAVTLAVVASLETLLSLEATDRMDPLKREAPANRELIAQGLGNALCGVAGGLPMTGVIVRSSANVYAGARTRASAILHGVMLLVAVVSIPALLNRIPLAALAAILLYTGYKLAHPAQLKAFLKRGTAQWVPFVVTIVAILLTDLLRGIGIGMATAIVFILLDHLRTPTFSVERTSGDGQRLRLNEHLTFLAKANLTARLQTIPVGSTVEIDGSRVRKIDHDVAEVLREFRAAAPGRRITVSITGLDTL